MMNLLISISFIIVAADANAQDAPPEQPLLAGPAMVEEGETAPATLVERTFDGYLIELEEDPYAAAIARIELTQVQQTKLEEVVSARTAAFDEAIRDNYGLIVELAAGLQSKSNEDRIALMGKVREAFAEFTARGTLLDEMKPVLAREKIGEIERLVREYGIAKLADMRGEASEEVRDSQLLARWRLELLGQEFRRSIVRQTRPSQEMFDQLLASLDLAPEQEAKIRAIVQPFAVKRLQNLDTQEDRAQIFRDIREVLDVEQREKLWKWIVEQRPGG